MLVVAQDRLAEGRGNAALSLIAVYKALGGGWRMRYAPGSVETVQAEATTEAMPRPIDDR